MLQNMEHAQNNSAIIHSSVNDLAYDFHGTMKCILRALADTMPMDVGWNLRNESIKDLDINSGHVDATHVTTGKYNNTDIVAALLKEPFVAAASSSYDGMSVRSCGPTITDAMAATVGSSYAMADDAMAGNAEQRNGGIDLGIGEV